MHGLEFSTSTEFSDLSKSRIAISHSANADTNRFEPVEVSDSTWVRERIAEGLASGVSDKHPTRIIKDIIANRRARCA
jgi:hypothetical protein